AAPPRDEGRDAAVVLDELAHTPLLAELGRICAAAGEEVAIVGGPVLDALRGQRDNDWDLTTSARPDRIESQVAAWADAVTDIGREFGTIGLLKNDRQIEITTYRSDTNDQAVRKPHVEIGDR